MQDLPILKVFRHSGFITASVLALIAFNLWQLSKTVWLGAELAREPVLPVVMAKGERLGGQDAQYSVQTLLSVPLFGEKPAAPVAASTEVQKDVRKSALKIKVEGLIAGDGESGVAVLSYSGKTKAYAVGEKLDVPGSVILIAVYADHIIIENNRKQEKIELDKKTVTRGVTAVEPATSSSTMASSRLSSAGELVDLNNSAVTELIGDPRETLKNSPLKLARYLSITPVNEDGRIKGYAVSAGRDPRLFELIDMQPGDVVLSINGQNVADMTTTEVLEMLDDTSSFELLVERSGTILSKRLEL
ncbi:type II secretion system protein GspC [Spongiibacter sp. KMU-158]|uniref:Type II secretion system protein GspC n=1 Tax=Spongiibacter pelagi TaxID=2760804 RepID=A0A927GVM1_9GAMM|nr:type II secretion system protein GspC [Spongiibacter pelagi]MBD2858545.1 type II secretion system protein GspC [Spongiibacter pelagi]